MLNIEQCLEELTLESLEYAHLTQTTYHAHDSFKVHIPKIMPAIPFGVSSTWVEPVNTALYANAPECKITSASTVKCQNYLTLPRYAASNFSHKADINGLVHHGAVFVASVMNGNVKDMRLMEVL